MNMRKRFKGRAEVLGKWEASDAIPRKTRFCKDSKVGFSCA